MSDLYQNTTAKTLAAGSQDLAALAGFFCVDTVERNVLATQFGYGIVTTSALSILGIIGLVKSSIKLALGLEKCQKSGLAVESLRTLFGYSPRDAASGGFVPCDEIDVKILADRISIQKTRRFFDINTRPILRVGSDIKWTLRGSTALNLGNTVHENSVMQHPLVAASFAILWTGITSWLILVIQRDGHRRWDWVLIFATFGLHFALSAMLCAPIWFSFRCDRPGKAITSAKFDFLARGKVKSEHTLKRMLFTLYEANSGHGIYFHKDINFMHTRLFTGIMMFFSALCVVSYICQYTILKRGSSTTAAVWIGCQAALALFRLLYWIIHCPLDNASSQEAEYAIFANKDFTNLNLLHLASTLPCGITDFPKPIWEYLQRKSIRTIFKEAYEGETGESELEGHNMFFLDFPIAGLLATCHPSFKALNSGNVAPCRLGFFYKDGQPQASIVPRIFIEHPYLLASQNHSDTRTASEWVVLPRVIHVPGNEAKLQQPYSVIAHNRAWCVSNTKGSVGFVPRQVHHFELGYVYPEDQRNNNVVVGFREAFEKCMAEAEQNARRREEKDVYFCATRRVIPREPDAFAEGVSPPFQVAYGVTDFNRALNETMKYIDKGHKRRWFFPSKVSFRAKRVGSFGNREPKQSDGKDQFMANWP